MAEEPSPPFRPAFPDRSFFIQLLILAGVLLLFSFICTALGIFGKPPLPSYEVMYRIEGEGETATVHYIQANGIQNGPETVDLPWQTWIVVPSGMNVSLRVDNPNGESALSCEIYLDGKLWVHAEPDSPGESAFCSKTTP